MKDFSYQENYSYVTYERGEFTFVQDLAEADFAYAEEISCESDERFEVRRNGLRLGRFGSLEGAKEFLEGE